MASSHLNRRQLRGRRAENCVARLYRRRGYDIVRQNYSCRRGEIDLIARRLDMLVFVEVRSESTGFFGQPAMTVGPAKQRRIIAAARSWLTFEPDTQRHLRFDIVGVSFRPLRRPSIEVFENAFSVGEDGWAPARDW